MNEIRWAGELGAVGRWKDPMMPGMAKSKANPKQTCRLCPPFLNSPFRRKRLIRRGAPPSASRSSECRFQRPQGCRKTVRIQRLPSLLTGKAT
jgi:hypothetical protein